MKRNSIGKIFAALLLPLAMLGACNNTEETSPTIRAKSPEPNAEFDLSGGGVLFQWQVTGVITGGYTLTLATDETMVASKTYETAATSFSKEILSEDMDLLLKEWGYVPQELAAIYWKVEATTGNAEPSAMRPVLIRRLKADAVSIPLTAPATNSLIDLGEVSEVKFEWGGNSDISTYSLEFSLEQDGDASAVSIDGINLNAISGTSLTISSGQLTAMLTNLGLNNIVNSIYWKIRSKTTNAPGASESRRLRLIKIGAEGLSAVNDLKGIPGINRARLNWTVDDPRITKIGITWEGGGSKSINVGSDAESMETIIDGLAAGSYNFMVVAYDETGKESNPAEVLVTVYDDSFMDGLEGRDITLVSLKREGATVQLGIPIVSEFLQATTLRYIDASGREVTKAISDEAELLLGVSDITFGTTLSLELTYAPEAVVLDPLVKVSSVFVPKYGYLGTTPSVVANVSGDHGELSGYGYALMFDGIKTNSSNMWHTSGDSPNASGTNNSLENDPIMLTLDLGASVNLSSLAIWGRYGGTVESPLSDGAGGGSYWVFGSYNPRVFEVWGSDTEPANKESATVWAANGTWKDTWIKLADCKILRPGQYQVPTYRPETEETIPTAEDYIAAANGFEFGIMLDKPQVRYVRLVISETWDVYKRKRISAGELEFYQYTPGE